MILAVYKPSAKTTSCSVGSRTHLGVVRTFCTAVLLLVLGFAPVGFAIQKNSVATEEVPQIRILTKKEIVGPKDKPFNMPSDVAVGQDGSLYVLDGVNNRVVVYDAEGIFRFEFGSFGSGAREFMFPLGIATAPDGKVYVADSGNHRIQIFSSDGKPLEAVDLPTTGLKALPDPTDVALDAERSRLYIVDNDNHHLNVYDLNEHRFESILGRPGQGERQFRFPFFIDTSSDGYVIVVEPINTRVQVLSPSGKFVAFIGAWGVKPGQLYRPKGVATLGNRVFVSDSYLGRVQVFDLRGSFLGVLSDPTGAPMQFTTPTGIAIDAERRCLYVVELKANRVCRMELE